MPKKAAKTKTTKTAPKTRGGSVAAAAVDKTKTKTKTQNLNQIKTQVAMQRENAVVTAVSNILKSKHESAKNAIKNVL